MVSLGHRLLRLRTNARALTKSVSESMAISRHATRHGGNARATRHCRSTSPMRTPSLAKTPSLGMPHRSRSSTTSSGCVTPNIAPDFALRSRSPWSSCPAGLTTTTQKMSVPLSLWFPIGQAMATACQDNHRTDWSRTGRTAKSHDVRRTRQAEVPRADAGSGGLQPDVIVIAL